MSSEIDYLESLPDCPQCGHNMFVTRDTHLHDWKCEHCGTRFDAPRKDTQGRGGRKRS